MAVSRIQLVCNTGLVCGILAWVLFCCCCDGFPFNLLGLIFSLIGLSQINRHPELYEGRGAAIAGLVLSIFSLLLIRLFDSIVHRDGQFPRLPSQRVDLNKTMRADSQPVPPKIRTAPPLTLFACVVLGVAALGAGAVVFFFNPGTHGFYPVCMFHQLTGLYCTGCGGTRSLYALLHGNLPLALKDNALFVLALAALAARGAWFAAGKFLRRPAGRFLPAKYLWPLLAVAVVFTVLRNLPAFSFLSP